MFSFYHFVCLVFLFVLLLTGTAHAETPDSIANHLYRSLTGVSLTSNNPLRAQLIALINAKDYSGAAALITDKTNGASEFYDVTLVQFSLPFSMSESTTGDLNELGAMVIGNTRDDRAFDELLMEDFTYTDPTLTTPAYSTTNNDHFRTLERTKSPRSALVRMNRPGFPGTGIFTSRPWGLDFLKDGTNRRNIVGIVQSLYCKKMSAVKDINGIDVFVRRDVPRSIGGDPKVFQNDCKGCHAWMDPMSQAFAYLDWSNTTNEVTRGTAVAAKMNINNTVYPQGYAVTNDQWNLIPTESQNQNHFGFENGGGTGVGLRALGQAIANSKGVHKCMATRAAAQVYLKKVFTNDGLSDADRTELLNQEMRIATLADSFGRHHNLKRLFEEAAVAFLPVGN